MTANSQASKPAESAESAQPAQPSKPAITISIPTKENKQASQLRDALRIIAWTQFKVEHKGDVKGLKLYQKVFEPEWLKHEVQNMNFQQLMEYIKSLGYEVHEVLNLRNNYYANGRANNRNDRNQFPEESDFSDNIGF
ncbi:hypothetical protein ACE1CI_03330 [Aerosakkonemataceae cyanobacterium BLCC-F50]|uniref:Uncharacterized protein n=1 Tax=Floridaenema flaviceps BLCC-F50 TaxID=3153642 RepID=A0ABV4XJV0_9CYAN